MEGVQAFETAPAKADLKRLSSKYQQLQSSVLCSYCDDASAIVHEPPLLSRLLKRSIQSRATSKHTVTLYYLCIAIRNLVSVWRIMRLSVFRKVVLNAVAGV